MSTSSPASRIQAIVPELFKANLSPGHSYIRFQLTAEMTTFLAMEQVQESLIVDPEQITLLPSLPESVIGIMSSRNHVFCVFDLAQMLMLPSRLISSRKYHIIVLQTSQLTLSQEPKLHLGMAVDRIQGITRLTSEQIQSPRDSFPSSLTPYIRGSVIEAEKQILVLDTQAIIKAATIYESK